MLPNGLAHLPPIIARQLTLKITFSIEWPPRTRAEGGQVEPVLGGQHRLGKVAADVPVMQNSVVEVHVIQQEGAVGEFHNARNASLYDRRGAGFPGVAVRACSKVNQI